VSHARKTWNEFDEERKHVFAARDKYYKLMNEVEQMEIGIELALLEYEKGAITID
jgi:hypothetical protein